MKKLSIIVPVYNEKNSLVEIIRQLENVDFGLDKEIILIDDFSTDGTRDLYNTIPHKVIFHTKNMGKGASIKTGLKEADGDIIIIQDADLEYNPIDYIPLVNLIKDNSADVVYGSRLTQNENKKNFLLLSYLANSFLTFLTKVLYNIKLTDMETCYKAFRADIIKNININADRFDFEPEITAKILKQNVRFAELPITYNGRHFHEGKKITWKDGLQALYTLIKYKFCD